MSAIIFLAGHTTLIVVLLFSYYLTHLIERPFDAETLFMSVFLPIVFAGFGAQGLASEAKVRHRLNAAYDSGMLLGRVLFLWGIFSGIVVLLAGAILYGVAFLTDLPWVLFGALIAAWLLPVLVFECFEKRFSRRNNLGT